MTNDFGLSSDEPELNSKMIKLCNDELEAHESFMFEENRKQRQATTQISEPTIFYSWMD